MAGRGSGGAAARKAEVQGPSVDTILKEVVHNGGPARIPLLNRGNLKSDPCYWYYRAPSAIFAPEHRLAIIGGDTTCVASYSAEISEWCQCAQYLVNDLRDVLQLKYYKFWSYVLFDDDLQVALESYLRFAPRWFDPDFLVTPVMQSVQEDLHGVVMKVIMRMSAWRESQVDHMSPQAFADYLYDRIYDVARIVDICTLYGYTDDGPVNTLVRKMLASVLSKQPGLSLEFQLFAQATLESMSSLEDTCANRDPVSAPGEPSLLAIASLLKAASLKSMDELAIFDVCQAAVEIPVSLIHLMRHVPNEVVLDYLENVVLAVPRFFETVYPALDEEIERRKGTLLAGIGEQLRDMLRSGQSCAIEALRHFICIKCLDPLSKSSLDDSEALAILEKYYELTMQAVDETSFIIAYNSVYAVNEDIDLFRQNSATKGLVDDSQFDYLLRTIQLAITEIGLGDKNILGETPETFDGAVGGMTPDVENILAIMPDLRVEFVEKCLEFYNGKVDEVVTALMDNNLHPELEKFRDMQQPHRAVPKPEEEDGEGVHVGKKNKFDRGFLDDREAKESIRKVVLQYSQTYDEVDILPNDKMYDDEYDDTYDSIVVGLPEKDADTQERSFGVPRILQRGGERHKHGWEQAQEANADDDDSDDDGNAARKRQQQAFCEDPEVLRARREQKHQARLAKQGRPPPAARDVVGMAKGVGQSNDVLRNRQLKERHKGGNRRAQADWKRREF